MTENRFSEKSSRSKHALSISIHWLLPYINPRSNCRQAGAYTCIYQRPKRGLITARSIAGLGWVTSANPFYQAYLLHSNLVRGRHAWESKLHRPPDGSSPRMQPRAPVSDLRFSYSIVVRFHVEREDDVQGLGGSHGIFSGMDVSAGGISCPVC